MEILVPIIVIVVLVAAYIATQNYFKNVEKKYNVRVRRDWKRFIPAVALIAAVAVCYEEFSFLFFVVLLLGVALYGFLLFRKIGDVKDTVIVTILMSILSFIYVIVFIFAFLFKMHDRDQVD